VLTYLMSDGQHIERRYEQDPGFNPQNGKIIASMYQPMLSLFWDLQSNKAHLHTLSLDAAIDINKLDILKFIDSMADIASNMRYD
jgi:hypothetical protein